MVSHKISIFLYLDNEIKDAKFCSELNSFKHTKVK